MWALSYHDRRLRKPHVNFQKPPPGAHSSHYLVVLNGDYRIIEEDEIESYLKANPAAEPMVFYAFSKIDVDGEVYLRKPYSVNSFTSLYQVKSSFTDDDSKYTWDSPYTV